MTRTLLTIYAPANAWLVKLAQGWRLVEFPLAPVLERGLSVLMWRWETPRRERVAYASIKGWDHR